MLGCTPPLFPPEGVGRARGGRAGRPGSRRPRRGMEAAAGARRSLLAPGGAGDGEGAPAPGVGEPAGARN